MPKRLISSYHLDLICFRIKFFKFSASICDEKILRIRGCLVFKYLVSHNLTLSIKKMSLKYPWATVNIRFYIFTNIPSNWVKIGWHTENKLPGSCDPPEVVKKQ